MRRARREEGLTSTQLAVLMPALLFWIMLIVQAGLWYHAKQVSAAAAAEAVDAAQTPTGTAAAGEQTARAFLAQSGNLEEADVQVVRGDDVVTARVTGLAPQLVPGMRWRVTAVAEARTERFIPEPER